MTKTTLLFLCPDNALLGPLAEAYLNAKGRGLMRAFSAGTAPADGLNRHVKRLLSAQGIESHGLAPKPVDVFLMPHAIVPDRVVYLSNMAPVPLPAHWKATTSSHWWQMDPVASGMAGFGACLGAFERIRSAIDDLIEPENAVGRGVLWNVA